MASELATKQQQFVFEGELPSLNEIIAAQTPKFRVGTRWVSRYSEWKKAYTGLIVLQLRLQRIEPVENYPVRISFVVYVPNRRQDPDNILAGVKKMLLDGMKVGGILENDGWKQMVSEDGTTGDAPVLRVDARRPRVEVALVEVDGYAAQVP